MERKFTPETAYCKSLRKKMDNIKKDIETREKELDQNPGALPETCPGDLEHPKRSREGHRRIIEKLKEHYREAYNKHNNKCGGPPKGYQPDLEIDPKYLPTPGVLPIPEIVSLPWWARGGPIVDTIIDYAGKASTAIGYTAATAIVILSGSAAVGGGTIVKEGVVAVGGKAIIPFVY